ncbi:MAG: nitroreductase/quinone reductase family protein [Marmoricola sp.]
MDKFHAVTWVQRRMLNPLVRAVLERRLRLPGYALLETTGRHSGLPRRTPVGDGAVGSTFWVVSEHGRRSAYVRNIAADPRVRVCIRGRWYAGTAHLLPADDPRARQRELARHLPGSQLNALAVRSMGTDLLTVRVDLDAPAGP